jgi:hypothetical protein
MTDLVCGIALLVLSLAMIFVVIPAETEEGVWHGLSPYFYPRVTMAGIAVASALLALQAWRRRDPDEPEFPLSPRQLAMFALMSAIVLAGALAIERFGIWIGGPALIAGLMLFMGERRPVRLVATSVIPVAVVHALVLYVLRSPLP